MQIQTWKQNPPLKSALDACLQAGHPDQELPYWQIFHTEVEGKPTLIVQWVPKTSHGAFCAEGTASLLDFLKNQWPSILEEKGIQKIFLVVSSAGADVSDPFASLVGIEKLLEALVLITIQQNVEIDGVVHGPLGTFGGASLLLATVCNTIWCDMPEQIQLMGHAKDGPLM